MNKEQITEGYYWVKRRSTPWLPPFVVEVAPGSYTGILSIFETGDDIDYDLDNGLYVLEFLAKIEPPE